jgi:DNA sulfur modification protein DndD
MILQSLEMENFGPYFGEARVDFPGSGVVLVHGENGCGKTTIINAMNWCLYGIVLDRMGLEIDPLDLFNTDALDDGAPRFSVQMRFDHKDPSGTDHTYRLRRIAQVSSPARNGNAPDLEVICEVEIDGAIRHESKFDDAINEVLPLGVSRFFLFDGEMIADYEQLVAEDVSNQGIRVKQSIEMVLGVPSARRGKEDLEALVHEYEALLGKQAKKTKQSAAAVKEYERLLAERQRLKKDLEGATASRNKAALKLREAQEGLAKFKEYEDDANLILRATDGLNALDEKRAEWMERRRSAAGRLWQDVLNSPVQERLSELETEREDLAKAEGRVETARHQMEAIQRAVGDGTCGTCGQALPAERTEESKNLLAAAEAAVRDAMGAHDPERLDEVRKAASVLKSIVPAGVSAEIISLETDMRQSVVDKKKFERQISQAKERLKDRDPKMMEKFRRDEQSFTNVRAQAVVSIKSIEESLAAVDGAINKHKALINPDHNPAMVETEVRLEFLREVYEYFCQAVDLLVAELRAAVQDGANEAFAAMSERGLYSGLTINENYGLVLLDTHMRPVEVRSAGYEHIIAMSLIASLNRNAAVQAPVIMDTPFGRLDKGHRAGMLKFCSSMSDRVVLLVQSGEITDDDVDAIRDQVSLEIDIDHPTATSSSLLPR